MPATDRDGHVADPEAQRRHPHLFKAVTRRRRPRLRRTDITVTDEAAVKRAVKAASLGNAMEWFDFGIYAYLAVTLGHVFFPSGNEFASLMLTFMTFGAGFLMRPLGAIFLGAYVDRVGRREYEHRQRRAAPGQRIPAAARGDGGTRQQELTTAKRPRC